jgi:hypothetical protein
MGVQRLGVSTPSANTDTLLYTADYPFLASVIGTNLTTSTSLIDVWVVPTGVTLSSGYVYYAYQTDIPPSNTLETHKFALNIGDRVYVRSTQNTSFNISGLRQVDIQLATGVTSFQNTAPANPINGQVWVDGDGVAGTNISSLAGYNVQASSATQVPFQVQGASGQTADLQQWDHVNGTPLARVDSTGLMYSQQSPVVNRDGFNAGGKNYVINGGFDIWQRGTSFVGSGNNYTADRWKFTQNGPTNNAYTVSRQSSGLNGFQYCARFQRNSGDTGTGGMFIGYGMASEDLVPFQGKTMTMSFYARAGANFSGASQNIGFSMPFGTGTGAHPFTLLTNEFGSVSSTFTLSTSWQRFYFTATVPSNATEMRFNINHSPTGTAGVADYYEVTGFQMELGSTPTAFSRYGGTYQGELVACQRYFQSLPWGPTYNTAIHSGHFWSSTKSLGTVHLKTTMRTNPAVTISSPSHVTVYSANTTYAVSSIGVDAITAASFDIEFVTSSAGTAGYGTFNRITNTSGYLWISAEL